MEHHSVGKTVDELGAEGFLHLCEHRLTTTHIACETDVGLRGILSSGIRGHDEDDVAEVSLLTLVVGKSGIVHHLEQDVVDVAVCLLYLVEQKHAVGRFADSVGELSTVLVAHIACRRANEFGNGMLLGVFGHIEAHQLDAQLAGEDACHLGLAHSRRSYEEERRHRLVVVDESCLRHHHGFHHLVDGCVLTIDLVEHSLAQRCQGRVVFVLDGGSVYLAHLGENLLNDGLGDIRALAVGRMHLKIGAGLIHEVDGLVGQEAVADVLVAGPHRIFEGVLAIGDAMIDIVLMLQPLENLDGFVDGRLLDVDLLETAHDALALRHVAVVLLVGSGTNEADVASLEILLEHVGGIRSAIRASSGSYHVVNLVDIDDDIALLGSSVHHHLDAFLEVATILRSGKHLSDVHAVDAGSLEAVGHLILVDEFGKSEDEGCLSHTRLAHVQRIVFLGTAEHLYGAVEFFLAADERIVLVYLVGDAGDELMPVGGMAFSGLPAFRVIILIVVDAVVFIVVIVVIIPEVAVITVFVIIIEVGASAFYKCPHLVHQLFIAETAFALIRQQGREFAKLFHFRIFLIGKLFAYESGELLALLTDVLVDEIRSLSVGKSQHGCEEMSHIELNTCSASQVDQIGRAVHRLEKHRRLGLHMREFFGNALLLLKPRVEFLTHGLLVDLHPAHDTDNLGMVDDAQQQMLGHEKLVMV